MEDGSARRFHFPELDKGKEEDLQLDTTRSRLTNVLKRHEALTLRLSRDSDKVIFNRLQKEFEAAVAMQTEEILLDEENWNDGLLATIRERVHMEADRKSMPEQGNLPPESPVNRIRYRVDNKLICCLEGARIGIRYSTFFAEEPSDVFYCVLESKSFLEKITVMEHTVPFFLSIREAENAHLSSNAIRFIDHVGEILQAYVDRREQVRLLKELYEEQIKDLYHNLSYSLIEFVLDDFDCKVTVSLRYADLTCNLPSRIRVLAWPGHASKKILATELGAELAVPQTVPCRLGYAEDALRTQSLPQAYADIVLSLPGALMEIFPQETRPLSNRGFEH